MCSPPCEGIEKGPGRCGLVLDAINITHLSVSFYLILYHCVSFCIIFIKKAPRVSSEGLTVHIALFVHAYSQALISTELRPFISCGLAFLHSLTILGLCNAIKIRESSCLYISNQALLFVTLAIVANGHQFAHQMLSIGRCWILCRSMDRLRILCGLPMVPAVLTYPHAFMYGFGLVFFG